MQNRSRVINKLALVLLSLVVLELVLIGDQVQSVKAIKKKIVLKKLKKLLPLLALVKPKKKIILLPIPIPMFKHSGNQNPYGPRPQPRPMITADGSAPMSFMMMTGEPGLVGYDGSSMPPHSFSMLPMTAGPTNSMDPASMMALVGSAGTRTPPVVTPNASDLPLAMMMPSMTMTIQSEPGGSSAIELSTNMNASPNSSAPLLLHRPQPAYNQNKGHSQQQQLHIQNDHFDEPSEQLAGGELYYSSPWQARQQPLASPAKLIRNERLRGQYQRPRQQYHHQQHQPQQQHHFRAPAQQLQQQQPQQPISQQIVSLNGGPPATSGKLQQMPILVIKNQWRPSPTAAPMLSSREQPARQQQAAPSSPPPSPPPPPPPQPPAAASQAASAPPRTNSAQEFEEFVPVGPPQMMPVYQNTRDGQLHMTPPPPLAPQSQGARLRQPEPASFEQEDFDRNSANSANSGDSEVQTIGGNGGQPGSAEQQQQAGPQSGDHNGEAPAPLQRLPEREQQLLGANSKLPAPSNKGLASPVVKGKQQQQQGKHQEPFGGGGY